MNLQKLLSCIVACGMCMSTLSAVTVNVTSLADSGAGTLRAAITTVNGSGVGPHTITFTGLAGTITLLSDLPTVTRQVTIDGTTSLGWVPNTNPITQGNNANLTIELKGPGAGFNIAGPLNGLRFGSGSNGSQVLGLVINDFAKVDTSITGGCGIRIDSQGCTVAGCFIGSDPTGTVSHPCFNAIRTTNSSNIIGGSTNAARNLISGNYSTTGSIRDGGSLTQILGNTIGLARSGTVALQPDACLGIRVGTLTQGTTVKGNVIAGFSYANVNMRLTDNVLFQNNFVGTDVSGTQAVGPNGIGVIVFDSPVYGPTNIKIDGNLISGNVYGIHVGENSFSFLPYINVQITNNKIGTDVNQTYAIPNERDGIWVKFAMNSYITGNTISGNGRDGIRSSKGRNSFIQNNVIGSNRALTLPIGNGRDGIHLGTPANGLISFGDVIGGARPGEGNYIANNAGCGIKTVGQVKEEVIQGNTIVYNGKDGILIGPYAREIFVGTFRGSNDMRILGDLASQGPGKTNLGPLGTSNIIAHNGGEGIKVKQSHCNVIQTNIITDNGETGVKVQDGSHNMIGGAFPGNTTIQPVLGNVIADNGRYGVEIEEKHGKAVNNPISTNQIGGNKREGIELKRDYHSHKSHKSSH